MGRKASIKKTIAYRICSVATSFLIDYVLFGQLMLVTAATIFCLIAHTTLYYLFERYWK